MKLRTTESNVNLLIFLIQYFLSKPESQLRMAVLQSNCQRAIARKQLPSNSPAMFSKNASHFFQTLFFSNDQGTVWKLSLVNSPCSLPSSCGDVAEKINFAFQKPLCQIVGFVLRYIRCSSLLWNKQKSKIRNSFQKTHNLFEEHNLPEYMNIHSSGWEFGLILTSTFWLYNFSLTSALTKE